MSTYSSLVKSSKAFERLFKILHKVFLVMTIVLAVMAIFAVGYFPLDYRYTELDRAITIIYIMCPPIITLVLTIASYIAAKLAFNIRLELPVDDKK